MANIRLENVSVEFPIFNSSSRSLTNSLISVATGGRISADKSGHLNVEALQGINLDLKSGDRLGIVGHNGSGKSTLLRIISGIYEPTFGTIKRVGKVASLIDFSLGINPENTGKENIYLRGQLMGLSNNEISKKFDDIIDFAELGDFIQLPVRTYSSGMLLRLAFAVSTAITADILVMDEWLSVGDGAFAQRAQQRLEDLVENSEILVIASHSQSLIQKVSKSMLWLDHGNVRAIGNTEELVSQYFGKSPQ